MPMKNDEFIAKVKTKATGANPIRENSCQGHTADQQGHGFTEIDFRSCQAGKNIAARVTEQNRNNCPENYCYRCSQPLSITGIGSNDQAVSKVAGQADKDKHPHIFSGILFRDLAEPYSGIFLAAVLPFQ